MCCALLSGMVISGGVAAIADSNIISADAAVVDYEESAENGIVIHYKDDSGKAPNIYYWNSLPQNMEVDYPGIKMTADSDGWYSAVFSNVTKINFQFIVDGEQSAEMTKKAAGEYWYLNGKWYNKLPNSDEYERTDMRQESIYFVMTTRFYDGDSGNNVHCWEDTTANNPDSDPAWRGDFQGLIDKLDYIKALGFSAIWITPVVENASGYDYHGYHAYDFSKVDPRYESSGATFQDLIDACHDKGIKLIQDVVWNHSGNFGEVTLGPMFTKEYNSIQDLGSSDCMKIIPGSDFDRSYPNYDSLTPYDQFLARLDVLKDLTDSGHDPDNNYHREKSMGYESSIEQQGSMADDCVDLNTENPYVAEYLTSVYRDYADMGVDAFRLDTEKHINRWTLNSAYFPAFSDIDNFFIFGEVCSRVRETWNHNIPSSSPAFFTWAETESEWIGNWNTTDRTANIETSIKHYDAHKTPDNCPTSDNVFLHGNSYHTPDYSKSNGTGVIDFTMHRNFQNASSAYRAALNEDQYINDSTWVVTYVDSHDYGPDGDSDEVEKYRYNGGTQAWAENLSLMFTFRGIPCIYYGSEIEFQKGVRIDPGTTAPLAQTGRAYFGEHLEGTVTATDYSQYTASGTVADTLNNPLAKHIQRLNQIRRAVPALQMGQYSTEGCDGNMAYKRRYTADGIDSYCLVTVSGGATFSGVENGTYVEVVTGEKVTVSNGTLTSDSIGQGNLRCYVLQTDGAPSGKIGEDGVYLK
ncbi:MAG: starch-binding protein [Lachnospiraceae bacterium]|nr:starch-binding protein [Lachnospiraceae bacterium]